MKYLMGIAIVVTGIMAAVSIFAEWRGFPDEPKLAPHGDISEPAQNLHKPEQNPHPQGWLRFDDEPTGKTAHSYEDLTKSKQKRLGYVTIIIENGGITLPRDVIVKVLGAEDCGDEKEPMPAEEEDDGTVTFGPTCACVTTSETVTVTRSDGSTYETTMTGCNCPPGCPEDCS